MEDITRLLALCACALACHGAQGASVLRQAGSSAPLASLTSRAEPPSFDGVRAVTADMRGMPRKLRHAGAPRHALPAASAAPPLPPLQTEGAGINIEGMAHGAGAGGVRGAVGEQQYVQLAGGRIAVYRKHDGALQAGPVGTHALFAEPACAAPQGGAGAVLYDHLARRWIVTHTAPHVQCIAVSVTADAAGSYYRYALPLEGALQVQDAQLALWSDAYIMTFTLFGPDGQYRGPRACAIDRLPLQQGRAAPLHCEDAGSSVGPAVAASIVGAAPPRRTPALLVSVDFTDDGSGERLLLWRLRAGDAMLAVPVAPFRVACGDACIAQPAPGGTLSAPGDRVAPQAIYRDGALLLTHAVRAADGRTALRWYELRDAAGAVRVYQQGNHAPDALHRSMGSIGIDRAGNIALGFSVAGADTPAGVRVTGRVRTDPPGRMQGEQFIVNGSGVQPGDARRWAASGALSLDPQDGCTFWYTQHYLPLSGQDRWRSRIASFRFRACP